MRTAFVLWGFVLFSAFHARADVCADVADSSRFSSWPLSEKQQFVTERVDGRSWDQNKELLKTLAKMLRSEPDDALGRLAKLALLLDKVANEYDGTVSTAAKLRVAAVEPSVCGLPIPGLPPPTCSWTIPGGDRAADEMSMPLAVATPCTSETRFAGYVRTLAIVLAKLQSPAIGAAAKSLTRYDEQWERLLSQGFSQYPWEVAINGLFQSSEGWGPNKRQMVLAHAFVGVGVGDVDLGKKGDTSSYAAAVVGLEALGYLRYFSDFRHHLGIGLAGISPNLTWTHRGWGPVVHFSGLALGYAYGFRSDESHTLYLLIDVTHGLLNSEGAAGKIQDKFLKYLQ